MSLTDLLPEVQSLSRLDKIKLIQILAQELEGNEAALIEPGRSYPLWSSDQALALPTCSFKHWSRKKGNHDHVAEALIHSYL